MTQHRIETLPAAELDLDLAERMAQIRAACLRSVDVAPQTGPTLLLSLTVGSGEPSDDLVFLAREGEQVLGWGHLTEPQREYTGTAFLNGFVLPDRQRQGIGTDLLAAMRDRTARGRLRARAWEGSAGTDALPALGFRRGLTHLIRRLSLDEPDTRWTALRREAEQAAADYELVRRVGATPEADLAEMVQLREAINDAPDATEWEAYPPDRIVAYERALEARRQTQYAVVARHRATGDPAGVTLVAVDEFSPSVAHQEDTSVLAAHRGHRLGLLLKLDMIEWLRQERPEVTATETWNDASNHHMIAVNEQLGMRVAAANGLFLRDR